MIVLVTSRGPRVATGTGRATPARGGSFVPVAFVANHTEGDEEGAFSRSPHSRQSE
jgi:hypothetical protein